MKYFFIESILKNPDLINNDIMQEHINYTQSMIKNGSILISGLKTDMSGAMFIIKLPSIQDVENYLNNEPFKKHDIQNYKITEFSPHYFNTSGEWFINQKQN